MTVIRSALSFLIICSLFYYTSAQIWPTQSISPPVEFDNVTQWGIGVATTPDQLSGIIVGFNYTNGQAFAQFYETNSTTGKLYPFGTAMFSDILTGFDTTEMNPAGAFLSTDALTTIWSVSTINDSNIAYGYVYIFQRTDTTQSFQLSQRLTDPQIGIVNRLYGGALDAVADGSLFVVGAAVYPITSENTDPSNVEVWIRLDNGSYVIEQTISRVETQLGLFGYSLAISSDKRWLAIGAWANHSLYFYYDLSNNYTFTMILTPFGDVTRFSYSLVFSPDVQWLVVGVFQYPSPGFVGAVMAYRFNETADDWNTENGYLLSTSAATYPAPGQGASVGISSVTTVGDRSVWTLAYGMPYYENIGAVSVWYFDTLVANWTESLPPLMANYSSSTFYDMGWSSTAANMVSYDGCKVIVAGIGNVGEIVGTVFQWMVNATGLCSSGTTPIVPGSPAAPHPSPTNTNLILLPLYIDALLLVVIGLVVAVNIK